MKKQLLIGLLFTYVNANHVYDMTQEEFDAFQKNPKVLMEIVQTKQMQPSNNKDESTIDNKKDEIAKKELELEKKAELIAQKENKNEEKEKELNHLQALLQLEKEEVSTEAKLVEIEKKKIDLVKENNLNTEINTQDAIYMAQKPVPKEEIVDLEKEEPQTIAHKEKNLDESEDTLGDSKSYTDVKVNDNIIAEDDLLLEKEKVFLPKEEVQVIVKEENQDVMDTEPSIVQKLEKPQNQKLTQKEAIELLKKKLLAQHF